MSPKANILIVEDDEAIATGLALNLKLEGYQSRTAGDIASASAAIAGSLPDLILLDLGMPEGDGLDLLRKLRDGGDHTPVIVVSARDREFDKVAALRLGADDYVTKPFALAEVMARIDAVLRRVVPNDDTRPLLFGEVEVDLGTRTVRRSGGEVKLTHLEFELLHYFLSNPAQVLSRETLLRDVWGQRGDAGSRRTVDNFVGQLRAKLESDPESPKHFVTVRGSGYRFDPEEPA
jgi:DNA-binding response OmpR family regulator